jgi:proton-dependent oligopeptide transporter, POT family
MPSKTKQPHGFNILFLTELWERFGFYTIQALLILYLIRYFQFSDEGAYSLFAVFGMLIYTAPLLGGYVADRLVGFRLAINIGSLLLAIGYIGIAVSSFNYFFYLSLACVLAGNGLFKSSVSSLLGTLYQANDTRRNSGFTLFYMGINIGSLSATVFSPLLAYSVGFCYGFIMAGMSLLIGLFIFNFGLRHLPELGRPHDPTQLSRIFILGFRYQTIFYFALLTCIVIFSFLLIQQRMVNWVLLVFGILALVYFLKATAHLDKKARSKLMVLIILMIFSIIFWALYMQVFMSLTLFSERLVDRYILGWEIPAPMLVSFVAIFVILLSPVYAKLWAKLNQSQYMLSPTTKFALGILLQSFTFLCLAVATTPQSVFMTIAMVWILIAYFLQANGELLLSPIGLAAVTQLIPPRLLGFMMGAWFLALGVAFSVAGLLANFASVPKIVVDLTQILTIYNHAFWLFSILGLLASFLLICIRPILLKLATEE